ncbi:MAG: ABC transporter ATP-binding protein [Nitrospiraceae bacterium]
MQQPPTISVSDTPSPRSHVAEQPSKAGLSTDHAPVLELRRISCAYQSNRSAITDISLTVGSGEIVCLLGPSGCGKTTTLRAIAGFEPVVAGEIYLAGNLMSSPSVQVPTEARSVGMVFQEYALFPHLRVADNITFGLTKLPAAQRQARVTAMLELTGLVGLEHRYPHELSGGQQQRVALARALAHHPVVLLLDEPFSNLDPDMASKMRRELHILLKRTNITTILVTHDHEAAFAIADRIAVLNEGRLEQLDTPEMIYHLPATRFVADFVGHADFVPGVVQDGRVTTDLGDFPNHGKFPPGTPLVVMIRPDDIRLSPDPQGRARILSRQFRGSENLYNIQLPSGRFIHSIESSTAIYPPGTSVTIRIEAAHTVLFKQQAGPASASTDAPQPPASGMIDGGPC